MSGLRAARPPRSRSASRRASRRSWPSPRRRLHASRLGWSTRRPSRLRSRSAAQRARAAGCGRTLPSQRPACRRPSTLASPTPSFPNRESCCVSRRGRPSTCAPSSPLRSEEIRSNLPPYHPVEIRSNLPPYHPVEIRSNLPPYPPWRRAPSLLTTPWRRAPSLLTTPWRRAPR
jgi:hypothetical protein